MANESIFGAYVQRRKMALGDVAEYLSSAWGFLSFGLVLIPVIMMVLYEPFDESLQPIASLRVGGPISLLCTFVIAFYMLSLRYEIHRYTHTASFAKKARPSIPIAALALFVGAIALAFILGFALAAKDDLVSPAGGQGTVAANSPAHMVLKLLFTGCLVGMLICLSLSAGLMAAYTFGKSVPTTGPGAPLYADEAALKDKVIAAVSEELQTQEEPTVSDLERLPGGGISISLRYRGGVAENGEDEYREEKTVVAQADHMGRLTQVKEKGTRPLTNEPFRLPPVLHAVREVLGLGDQAKLTVHGIRRENDGSVTMDIEDPNHKQWVVHADRWSRLTSVEQKGPTSTQPRPGTPSAPRGP